MAKKKNKSPSRIKYEKNNPVISARLPIAVRDKLLQNGKTLGLTVSEMFKNLAGKLELKAKPFAEVQKLGFETGYKMGYQDAYEKYVVTYRCCKCRQPIAISTQEGKSMAATAMEEAGWQHSECPKRIPPKDSK